MSYFFYISSTVHLLLIWTYTFVSSWYHNHSMQNQWHKKKKKTFLFVLKKFTSLTSESFAQCWLSLLVLLKLSFFFRTLFLRELWKNGSKSYFLCKHNFFPITGPDTDFSHNHHPTYFSIGFALNDCGTTN